MSSPFTGLNWAVTVIVYGPSGVRMRTMRTGCSKSRHKEPESARQWAEKKHGASAIEKQLGYTTEVRVR